MAWIYLENSTDSICSQESEELVGHSEIMSDRLPTAKSTPIVKESFCLLWRNNASTKLLSGMTLEHLIQSLSEKRLTSYMEDFLARTLALQDMEKAWQESEADFFLRSCAWPKKSSPHSYSLKTFQPLQPEGDFKSLEKLPRWGMIVDGVLYPLHPLEPCTEGKDGSYWPTPQARAQSDTPSERKRHTPCLESAVMIATPTASQANKPILAPIPSVVAKKHGETTQQSIGRLNPEMIGKKLCAKWVSVLMGYPTTWTDLEPWAMEWCLSKSKKRLKS